jgi:hypothetical protein
MAVGFTTTYAIIFHEISAYNSSHTYEKQQTPIL